jgi:hypothetical protein
MYPIHPISEAAIKPYIGAPVSVTLHDRRCVYGTVTDCYGGHLYLMPDPYRGGTAGISSLGKKKTRLAAKDPKGKARISALLAAAIAIPLIFIAGLAAFSYGRYGYGYGYPYSYSYPYRRPYY